MKRADQILLILFACTLTGCAGQLYTYDDPDRACKGGDCAGEYPGILVYPLVESVDYYIQDKILAAKGELTHWVNGPAGKACTPTLAEERKLVPDVSTQKLIAYDSAFFETSSFSVDLNANGTLSKVGTSSTPGGKSLVDSLVSIATTVKTLNHGEQEAAIAGIVPDDSLPLCSHGRVWVPTSIIQ